MFFVDASSSTKTLQTLELRVSPRPEACVYFSITFISTFISRLRIFVRTLLRLCALYTDLIRNPDRTSSKFCHLCLITKQLCTSPFRSPELTKIISKYKLNCSALLLSGNYQLFVLLYLEMCQFM